VPKLATDLILVARSPASGRFRHRAAVDMALRAALFAELIFDDRLYSNDLAPAVTDQEPIEDHVLNTLRDAVRDHPGVTWRRWYRHVSADREVLTRDLIESGRWTSERDQTGRLHLRDTDQDASLASGFRLTEVAQARHAPADRDEAVLAVLLTMCGGLGGRPRPRDLRRALRPLLEAVGPVSDPVRRNLQPALGGCARAIRRRSRIMA
jgi:hypothetical protein